MSHLTAILLCTASFTFGSLVTQIAYTSFIRRILDAWGKTLAKWQEEIHNQIRNNRL